MGYLISAHIVRDKPAIERLAELPASIGYRVYFHRAADVCIVDTFRSSRPPEYPFQTPLPVADVPLELSDSLNALESVYEFLSQRKLANSFKKSYINFALILNRLLGTPVLSIISDDDDLDFACLASDGSLARLKCRSGDLLITYQNGDAQIQPLIAEFDDADEELLTDTNDLRAAIPICSVAERNTPWNSTLHAIAIEEWQSFASTDTMILGMGSFDPPEDESEWELIGGS